MAALAPMPSASESTAMAVTNGVFSSIRAASLRLRIGGGVGLLGPTRGAVGQFPGASMDRGTEGPRDRGTEGPRDRGTERSSGPPVLRSSYLPIQYVAFTRNTF